MKNAIRMFVLAAAALALTGSSAFAQATIHGDLLKDWANQKDMLVKMANAMPEDKVHLQAHAGATQLRRAGPAHRPVNNMLTAAIGGKTPRAAAVNMEGHGQGRDRQGAVLTRSITAPQGHQRVQTQHGRSRTPCRRPSWGPRPGHGSCFFLNSHTQDIYGQMAVYLRLNGVVPPATHDPKAIFDCP